MKRSVDARTVIGQALTDKLPEHLRARRGAMRRDWGAQVVALTVTVVCFLVAGLLVPRMTEIREERQLVVDPDTIKGLPPDLALLGKLGTFRALAIDWASIRADRLKDEGKTYEELQLRLTICRLAPRFPSVWVNAAWNMAYNISVMKYTPEERWQWVQNGIHILRDEAIAYNPKAVTLYKELAWIYWHKIGDFMDDDHLNYKRALAVEMEQVLGPPPLALSDEDYFAWFRKIADAPRDVDQLIAEDEAVAMLVDRLSHVDLAPDLTLLDFVARHIRPELRVSDLAASAAEVDPRTQRRLEVVTDPKEAKALERLLGAVRSRELRERLKLDPNRMLKMMVDQYGPLDWRNAFSHTLYWSSLGDEIGRGQLANTRNEKMTNARFVFYALQKLITAGRVTLWPDFDDPFSSYIELTPDLRYIPYLFDTYMRLGEELFKDDPRYVEPPGPIYKIGLVSSMHTWITLLYLEGGEENIRQAENYYAWLREHNPDPYGKVQEQYMQTLNVFVMGTILDGLKTYKAAGSYVRSLIRRGLKHWSLGRTKPAIQAVTRARQAYDYWMVDTKADINERRKMQPFRVILRGEIESFLRRPDVRSLYKARLWRELPLEQRQMVYDHLKAFFDRLCSDQQPPWDVRKAFGEPADMEAFRKRNIQYRGAPRRKDVEQGKGTRG